MRERRKALVILSARRPPPTKMRMQVRDLLEALRRDFPLILKVGVWAMCVAPLGPPVHLLPPYRSRI
jgi:hypothetical protein